MGYTGRHRIPPRPVPRQKSAYRFALIGMSALILPALFVSGTELGRHGWDQFVLRDAMLMLLAMLMITPAVTLTGQVWFTPLRRWYGIVLGCTATADAIIASITSQFTGGVIGRVTGHTFLLAGLVMVLIMLPLLITANNASMRWLGRYWKQLQRLTYLVWFLLFVHLALLEGFGIQNGRNGPSGDVDHTPLLHQRLYQLSAVSLILIILRIPPVRRWVVAQRKAGRAWLPWLVLVPLIVLAIFAYAYIITEEVFKGVAEFRLQLPGGDG